MATTFTFNLSEKYKKTLDQTNKYQTFPAL